MFSQVTFEELDQQRCYNRLREEAKDAGAIVTFTGLVRDYNTQGKIEGIHLEHYPGMTDKALTEVALVAMRRFSLLSAGIVHRVGDIGNNDQIVWVGTASSHRHDAFQAAQYMMDMLKKSVPLWKKEYQQGQSGWVAAKASDEEAALAWLKKG